MDLFTLLALMFLLPAAAAEEIVKFVGDDVILRCEAGDGFIRAVEWTRPDLKEGEYALFYRDGRSIPTEQHESFRDRVQLVDRQPQDRNVSLILKNVTNNDAGTYECRVYLGGSRRKKRAAFKGELFQTIGLTVKDRETVNLTVSPGDNVTLRCEAGDGVIKAVEWTRPDLKKGECVLLYTDGHTDLTYQHESFRDRVQLVDRQLQDRDVSLILKNVTTNDAGTYECRVALGASRRKKRGVLDEEPIRVIHLKVIDRDSPDGIHINGWSRKVGVGLGVAAGVAAGVLVSGIGYLIWKHNQAKAERFPPEDVTFEEWWSA
ncbi:signal-regulatory protein beta-2-like [Centropristis striata]|uniref:signal-regulatory protein beta-2-like n=1 Tax=Centropristis striata TaxID=184440 RepID=UPI0027E06749|nr:signal-regulatory protein beta-2-like [Centropristis striata]